MYFISRAAIQSKECVKDLSVAISNDFSWLAHYFEIVENSNYVANSKLHSFVSDAVSIHMRAFDIHVRPILEYTIVLFGILLFNNVDLIAKVQKNFTRSIQKM